MEEEKGRGTKRHDVGECQDCKWWDDFECMRPRKDGAKMYTSEGHEAIMTDADFGCVQWEGAVDQG